HRRAPFCPSKCPSSVRSQTDYPSVLGDYHTLQDGIDRGPGDHPRARGRPPPSLRCRLGSGRPPVPGMTPRDGGVGPQLRANPRVQETIDTRIPGRFIPYDLDRHGPPCGVPPTRFPTMLASVHHSPPPSVTSPNMIEVAAGERWRTG